MWGFFLCEGMWEVYSAATGIRKWTRAQGALFVWISEMLMLMLIRDCVGKQPFNAFLAGFSATVGQFVLTASLRIQTNPENKSEFRSVSHERLVFFPLLLALFFRKGGLGDGMGWEC